MSGALSVDAVLDASAKVDRALQAGAYALGAKCIITQLPGYIIPFESEELKDVVYQNLVEIFGAENCKRNGSGGSTDASDVSVIMPVVHMNIGGARGIGHSSDYEIAKARAGISQRCQDPCLYRLLTFWLMVPKRPLM